MVDLFCLDKGTNSYQTLQILLVQFCILNMPKNLQLELLEHIPIRDVSSGLNEPSGLALNRSGSKLYTVSDDTKIIFNLDLQGKIMPIRHFSSSSSI